MKKLPMLLAWCATIANADINVSAIVIRWDEYAKKWKLEKIYDDLK